MKNLLIVISLFTLTACNDKADDEKSVKKTDSLIQQAQAADSLLKNVDTARIRKTYTEVVGNLRVIQDSLKDTISKGDAILLHNYRSLKKPFEVILSEYSLLKNSLDSSSIRLKNLKHDLENNSLKKEYNKNDILRTEGDILSPLHERVFKIVPLLNDRLKKFDSLNPSVKEVRRKIEETGKVN